MSGALYGLIGVVIGALLTWFRDIWSDRRARGRNARYLAIRVVCILDKYVERCAEVVSDEGEEDREGCTVARVSSPTPPEFPLDLDWKSIDHELMYRLLSLPNEAETAASYVDSVSEFVAGPPDFAEYFEERQVQYSKVGLSAFALTQELRKMYGIPAQEFGHWNPAERLAEVQKKVEQFRQKRAGQFVPPPAVADVSPRP